MDIYICNSTILKMILKISQHKILVLLVLIITVSCSKQEKNEEGIVKINKNGIPVMQPLQEPLPLLSTAFINDKKYSISKYFEKSSYHARFSSCSSQTAINNV
jgi:hypothetical protein